MIGDQVVEENGKLKTIFDLGLQPHNTFPFEDGWLVNRGRSLEKIVLEKVDAITTNEITTADHKVRLYKDTYQPTLESLEGAALHYVALMENIQFIQLRSISNYIGERDKKKWRLQESITTLNKALVEMLDSL